MFKQLTVYALVKDLGLLQTIEKVANECCSSVCVKKETDVLLHLQWANEGSKIFFNDSVSVPFMHRLVVLITDFLDINSGLVTYAVHKELMPVLSLKADAALAGEADRTAAALYSAPVRAHGTAAAAAVAHFFRFESPPGRLFVLEGPSAACVRAQGRALVDRLGAGAVLLGSAGSVLDGEAGQGGEEEEEEEESEVARSHFAGVMQRAYDHIKSNKINEERAQLFGAISVVSRHRNLPILRYRLQRGINVVLCRPKFVTIEKILHCCEESQMNSEDVGTLLKNVMERLDYFEFHMMDMPKPALVLCVNESDRAVSALNKYIEGREIILQTPANQLDPALWEAISSSLMV